jgi:hypothetical protein
MSSDALTLHLQMGRLDRIVLNKANRFVDYQLPLDRFDRVFQNSEF